MRWHEEGDQASGLRGMSASREVNVIAVTSGKGGVGKTSVSVNLAVALAQMGRRTLLLDADLGLANVDVMLGISPRANLSQVMAGELDLEDILVTGPAGLQIVPAASGVTRMASLSAREQGGLISAFATLPVPVETMVVDTAAGIDPGVLGFCQAAHEVVVVVCDEPASLTDAYALIKVMSQERNIRRFQVLCNSVPSNAAGKRLFQKLLSVCDRFLDVTLAHCASVPEDAAIRRAVRAQRAVVDAYPSAPASRAFKEMAVRADSWDASGLDTGGPVFFLERVLDASRARMTAAVDSDVRG